MNGVPVGAPVTIPWRARHRRATLNFAVGPWVSGAYFVKLTADMNQTNGQVLAIIPFTIG